MHTEPKVIGTLEALREKIESKTARVGIVGLGYVGLPLAVEFAKAGFHVTGIDVQQSQGRGPESRRITRAGRALRRSRTSWSTAKRFNATTDFSVVRELDTINICVPTPLRKTKDPDMSYIVSAVEEIAKYFHPGLLVILESTTYPGTTDELLLPTFEKLGLKVGRRLLPLLLARARRSRQPRLPDAQHAEGGRRHHAGLHRDGHAVLLAGAGERCPGHPTRAWPRW